MKVPHPSITGMAAGFSILDDLNRGDVIGDIVSGNIGGRTGALTNLTVNSQNLVKTEDGRKALFQAVGIAALGAFARKSLPGTKLGGTKFYFRKLPSVKPNLSSGSKGEIKNGPNHSKDRNTTIGYHSVPGNGQPHGINCELVFCCTKRR